MSSNQEDSREVHPVTNSEALAIHYNSIEDEVEKFICEDLRNSFQCVNELLLSHFNAALQPQRISAFVCNSPHCSPEVPDGQSTTGDNSNSDNADESPSKRIKMDDSWPNGVFMQCISRATNVVTRFTLQCQLLEHHASMLKGSYNPYAIEPTVMSYIEEIITRIEEISPPLVKFRNTLVQYHQERAAMTERLNGTNDSKDLRLAIAQLDLATFERIRLFLCKIHKIYQLGLSLDEQILNMSEETEEETEN